MGPESEKRADPVDGGGAAWVRTPNVSAGAAAHFRALSFHSVCTWNSQLSQGGVSTRAGLSGEMAELAVGRVRRSHPWSRWAGASFPSGDCRQLWGQRVWLLTFVPGLFPALWGEKETSHSGGGSEGWGQAQRPSLMTGTGVSSS